MRYLVILLSGLILSVISNAASAQAQKMSPPDFISPMTCANVRCGSGTYCAERPGGPTCEPMATRPTCASTLCQIGNQCVETNSGPQCVPIQPSYPTHPPYNSGQSCAFGGYYHYGRLVCYPPPAWRTPYQYGWGQYYRPQPVPTPRPTPRPRPPWHPNPESVEPEQPPRFCTMQYDPVCAEKPVVCVRAPCPADRKTFGNSCMARQDGYTVLYKGVCR